MYDVTALGELLVDFTVCGKSDMGMNLFEQNPGGAPANVLCALSNLGLKTSFIGKVGCDMHGEFLMETIRQKGVDVAGLIKDPNVFTTLAFVQLSDMGERSFSFSRKPGADTCLTEKELDFKALENTKIFHFGSLSLTGEPVRSATFAAVKAAKNAGAMISYDPNYRELLWHSREEAAEHMRSVLDLVDIIKISEQETELITGLKSAEDASMFLLDKGIPCVVVTLGSRGAAIRTEATFKTVPAVDCEVIDTTGAGDSFWGGFLYKLLQSGRKPNEISDIEADDFLIFANSVATLCVQKRGAIPAMPALEQAMDFYNKVRQQKIE